MTDPATEQVTDNQNQDFVSMLSQENQSHPAAAKFKGKQVDDVFQSYTNLETMVNKKQEGLVRIPGADAPEADRQAFHKALGVPDKPEAYEVPDFGKDFKKDEKLETWFRQTAHKHGMTPGQFKGLYQDFVEQQKAAVTAHGESTKQLFGDKFDDAVKVANRAMSKLPDELKTMVEPFVGFDPVVTQILHAFGQRMGESQSPDGGAPPAGNEQEFSQLIVQYREVTATKEYKDNKNAVVTKALDIRQRIREIGRGMGLNDNEIQKRIRE